MTAPRAPLALALAAQAVAPLPLFAWGALAPFVAAALCLTPTQLGTLIGLAYAGAASAGLPAGWLADRCGMRVPLALALGLAGAGLLSVAAWPSALACGMALALAGLAHGATLVLTTLLLTSGSPPAGTTRLGLTQTVMAATGMLGAASTPLLAAGWGWPNVCGLWGGMLGLTAGWAAWSAPPLPVRVRPAGGSAPGARHRLSWRLLGAGLLLGGAHFSFTAAWPSFLSTQGVPLGLAGSLLAVAQGARALSGVPLGWCSDRLPAPQRPRLLQALALAGAGTVLLSSLLPPGTAVGLWGLLAGLFGLTGLAYLPLYQALVTAQAAPGQAGRALGWATTSVQLGGAVLPPVYGLVLDTTTSPTAAWAVVALALLGAVACLQARQVPRPVATPLGFFVLRRSS